jgi:hypothetical protein
MPYRQDIIDFLPDQCLRDRELFRAVVPLICFNVLEWHQADRVLMQFGYAQHVPDPPAQDERLHDVSLRGKVEHNWNSEMGIYVQQWANRHQLVYPVSGRSRRRGPSDEYMRWYRKRTRRWMDQRNARESFLVSLIYVL